MSCNISKASLELEEDFEGASGIVEVMVELVNCILRFLNYMLTSHGYKTFNEKLNVVNRALIFLVFCGSVHPGSFQKSLIIFWKFVDEGFSFYAELKLKIFSFQVASFLD